MNDPWTFALGVVVLAVFVAYTILCPAHDDPRGHEYHLHPVLYVSHVLHFLHIVEVR